jgi:hypothetical protein
MKPLIYLSLAALILTSCATRKSQTIKTMDIYGTGVIQKPVIVDLDVNEVRIQGTATGKSDGGREERIKRDAVNDALEKAQADVLVEPKFKTETRAGKTTVIVSGFGATYKNFHSIKEDEVKLIKEGVIQKADVYKAETTKKKHGIGWIITGILGGLVLFTMLATVGVQ